MFAAGPDLPAHGVTFPIPRVPASGHMKLAAKNTLENQPVAEGSESFRRRRTRCRRKARCQAFFVAGSAFLLLPQKGFESKRLSQGTAATGIESS